MFLQYFIFLVITISTTFSKTIDNKLTGTPEVKCGPDSIEIKGTTEDDFEGALFVKNWRTSGCFTAYEKLVNTTKNPTFTIPLTELSKCGLELRRHSQTRELEVFTVFVFSFHPSFVTMSDRAFAVHCIFQQQTITVATKFNFISDITTRATFNGVSAMPEPSLTIVNGRLPDEQLTPAKLVKVGDAIMFVWNMTHPSEIYGIQVEDCIAKTLDGRKMKILENGCTTDDIIISSVTYGERNQKAFADAMAFKFPDVEDIWIMCSVRTCIQKREHLLIETGISEEHLCKSEPKCEKQHRLKRQTHDLTAKIDGTDESITILHNKLQVIDVYANENSTMALSLHSQKNDENEVQEENKLKLCMLKSVYAMSAAFLIMLYFSTAVSGGILVYSLRKHSKQTTSHINNNNNQLYL
uniref:ZP domain-containing protein n=1 Tax=Panagrolaimus superbus TaxID=310955 RepID=A0A914YNZ7_9BILA